MSQAPREILTTLFTEAVAAVQADRCMAEAVPLPEPGRNVVVGAGKAAGAMAKFLEANFSGELSGLVVVPDGHEVACASIRVLRAAHPVPDQRSVAASTEVFKAAAGLSTNDQLICLLSGGGSSLLCMPAGGLTLADKQAVTRDLLLAGADIAEINCVRRHLSGIKGGRLAMRCAPAHCRTLAISDVPDDDPALIAAGPTTPDPTHSADALAVLRKYGIDSYAHVNRWLHDPASEAPDAAEPQFARCSLRVLANGADALAAAERRAGQLGIRVHNLGARLTGDARALAAEHADWVRQRLQEQQPATPQLLLSGGETTVSVRGSGRGGRNTEYLLALARALDGQPGVSVLACDTDGIDGSSGAAGAFYDPALARRWRSRGLDPGLALQRNDSAGFFSALDSLVVTGPTLTNVNDFRAVLMEPHAWQAA